MNVSRCRKVRLHGGSRLMQNGLLLIHIPRRLGAADRKLYYATSNKKVKNESKKGIDAATEAFPGRIDGVRLQSLN